MVHSCAVFLCSGIALLVGFGLVFGGIVIFTSKNDQTYIATPIDYHVKTGMCAIFITKPWTCYYSYAVMEYNLNGNQTCALHANDHGVISDMDAYYIAKQMYVIGQYYTITLDTNSNSCEIASVIVINYTIAIVLTVIGILIILVVFALLRMYCKSKYSGCNPPASIYISETIIQTIKNDVPPSYENVATGEKNISIV